MVPTNSSIGWIYSTSTIALTDIPVKKWEHVCFSLLKMYLKVTLFTYATKRCIALLCFFILYLAWHHQLHKSPSHNHMMESRNDVFINHSLISFYSIHCLEFQSINKFHLLPAFSNENWELDCYAMFVLGYNFKILATKICLYKQSYSISIWLDLKWFDSCWFVQPFLEF